MWGPHWHEQPIYQTAPGGRGAPLGPSTLHTDTLNLSIYLFSFSSSLQCPPLRWGGQKEVGAHWYFKNQSASRNGFIPSSMTWSTWGWEILGGYIWVGQGAVGGVAQSVTGQSGVEIMWSLKTRRILCVCLRDGRGTGVWNDEKGWLSRYQGL